ncbi:MAG: hydantoinase/oxoprolinase family protein, partial [Myxococcota bacterium]
MAGELIPDDTSHIDEHPLRVPILPIETVGAGGGSIAYVDSGGALKVGPRSAGAVPGPACYGRGGIAATVTDAHVVLGRIQHLLGGAMELDAEAAHRAVGQLASELSSTVEETAEAIVAIAAAHMARACKRVSMDRGVDPRTLTLVAFGGAGGLHACELADSLGCRDVIFPREPGVLSAEGISEAPHEASLSRSLMKELRALDMEVLRHSDEEVRNRLNDSRPAAATSTRLFLDTRYRGQTYTLPVLVTLDSTSEDVAARFAELHEQRYGYRLEQGRTIEVVALRAFAERRDSVSASPAQTVLPEPVFGPTTVSTYGATLWLPKGWTASMLPGGDWRVERTSAMDTGPRPRSEPLELEIHRQRLAAIAEEMGSALMRSAFSSNIKERRDFSCAVFDRDGEMLAQAAHIPVHLGSQPLSVQSAIARVPMERG